MSQQKEAAILPAATIIIGKDGPQGMEVFMVVRHHKIDFASGALVFPGGKLEPEDWSPKYRNYTQGADDLTDEQLAFEVAAIRETFEECGVLLARERNGSSYISAERLKSLTPYRDALNERDKGLLEMVQKEDLLLACDDMHPFAHWVTPAMMPKRFDTHFYIAKAPADHLAVHDGLESVDSVWITPQRLLEEADAGKWTIIFPTRCNIEMLAQANTTAEAIAQANARTIVRVLPEVELTDTSRRLRIPVEAGYPTSEAELDF